LQKEIISASEKIYSFKRLIKRLIGGKLLNRLLFMGEFFWQRSVCKKLREELPYLREAGEQSGRYGKQTHDTNGQMIKTLFERNQR